jgi:integrase
VIVIRYGKAHRVDEVPIHPELALALETEGPGMPSAKVFATSVTNTTRRKDFERSGIKPDEEGREADLHSLRVSLGTQLAREGVAPQVAQRIMRHADYRTTLKHYTSLGLSDDAAALARISGPSSTPSSQSTKQGDSVREPATNETPAVAT